VSVNKGLTPKSKYEILITWNSVDEGGSGSIREDIRVISLPITASSPSDVQFEMHEAVAN
jgi:hypothetical protein